MNIKWTEDLAVGVEVIDDQHKHFLGIINELYDAISENNSKVVIGKILEELDGYADYHFATEEKYFEMFKYDGAEEQIKEHRKMHDKIHELIADEKSGKNSVVIETVYFLEDWLKNHLAKLDHKFADCFHDHGLV